ncbi:hypothetical protein EYR38_007347 [Pleurotus pulmonarius]|nr:hypothetical protein EYR38_007347 [Pleurotus pulmonarius]
MAILVIDALNENSSAQNEANAGVAANTYFREYFGLIVNGEIDQKRLDAVTSNVVSVLQGGAFFGALGSAPISAGLGRRLTLALFGIIFIIGAVLATVAGGSNGLVVMYTGRVISGIGIGGISAVAPAYISECAPKKERGRITGLFSIMESPRWLASVDRNKEAMSNLAYLRKQPSESPAVIQEMAEIEGAIEEERAARKGLGIKEAFFGKGNSIRFVITFVLFLFQQLTGQNAINYYTPQIFVSVICVSLPRSIVSLVLQIGYAGAKNPLLASGIYGVVKVITTIVFISFFVDLVGRKRPLFVSALGMGTTLFIAGAVLKTHPPNQGHPLDGPVPTTPPASQAIAAMVYLYVVFYSIGWGPLPWIYSSEIFPTRTRHYGVAVGSASQWLWNFVITKVTPQMLSKLHYKMFFVYGAFNIGALAVFALMIPETTGHSLEDMDVIFGSATAQQRQNKTIPLEEL